MSYAVSLPSKSWLRCAYSETGVYWTMDRVHLGDVYYLTESQDAHRHQCQRPKLEEDDYSDYYLLDCTLHGQHTHSFHRLSFLYKFESI